MAEPARHFRIRDLAERWAVDRETVRREIKRGRLAALRIGGAIRVPRAVVEEYERENLWRDRDDWSPNTVSAAPPAGATGISVGRKIADLRRCQRARRMPPSPAPSSPTG